MHVAERRRRRAVVLGGAAAVLVLAAGGWAVFLRPDDQAAAAVSYRATAVTTGTLRQTVAASGTVAATDTQDVTFPASGKVTGVWVKAGTTVKKGQRLAAIDSAPLASALASARATLATAQATLAADTAAAATSAQLAADAAAVTVAKSDVAAATTDLAGATLTAPFAGTVTSVGYTTGQQVGSSGGSSSAPSSSSSGSTGSSGSSGSSGDTGATSGITVVSTGSYEVQATVDATDVALIKASNQVIITVGDSTQNVFGTVSSVGVVATSTSGVASFPVVVAVTGSPAGVHPGATASLQIVYKQLSDVLLVPTQAISRTDGAATVLVRNGSAQERRTIGTGLTSGAQTQVTSGLTEGEQVLVAVPTGQTGGGGQTGRSGYQLPGGGQGGFPGGGQGGFPGGAPPGGAGVQPGGGGDGP